jgi:hypothetical protein
VLTGGEGSWNYMRDHVDRVAACAVAPTTFCSDKAIGKHPVGSGTAECNQYWQCDSPTSEPVPMTCPTNQAFDGTDCVSIDLVTSCPLVTRACFSAGSPVAAGNIAISGGNTCSFDYYTCDGTNALATAAQCPVGQAFSTFTSACEARGMVGACVVATDFCAANAGAVFPDVSIPAFGSSIANCGRTYWTCPTNTGDAVPADCAVGTVPELTRSGSDFTVSCVAAEAVCVACDTEGIAIADPADCAAY